MREQDNIKDILALLRPKQWAKNIFVFVALFFTPQSFNFNNLYVTGLGFIAFCCAASLIYILNDWQDRISDQQHPLKRMRPLAAGKISQRCVMTVAAILLIILTALVVLLNNAGFAICIVSYLLLNLGYCLYFRRVSLLDIAAISGSFLLRFSAGAALIYAHPSPWIIIMTGLLALFLAAAKRRDDIVHGQDHSHRKSLDGYNLSFLDSLLQILCAVLLAAYFIYTTDNRTHDYYPQHELLFTTPFVVLGLMRYLQITKVESRSGSPTDLLWHDRFLQLCIAGWILTFGWLIYGSNL